jgi:predicted component of type VI protein secretion system
VASLRIVGADGSEKVVELRDRKLQIGRGRDNDVVLADPEKGVSRTHAELRFENGRYVIVDLQSQNGTWINGRRVDRSEVPVGAEITIGDYRLTILQETPLPSMSATAGATIVRSSRDLGDLQLRGPAERPAAYQPTAAHVPVTPPPAPQRNVFVAAVLVVLAVILFGAVAWVWGPGARSNPPAADGSDPASGDPRPSEPTAAVPQVSTPDTSAPAERTSDPASDAGKSNAARRANGTRSKVDRGARKPGESLETWRTRSEALETRYSYSKAALDRRDYAAAAGGFQAILLEEPGFLDAAQLLVQANADLRATANNLYQSGRKLDAAGDWVGALQKYEQARQIYSNLPGISDATERVREKLRTAGVKALAEGKQLEALGRNAEALKAYENAVQWLPASDPNRQVARARLEQLKKTQ